ncbi:nucleotidyltransferase [Patescibacteria group bacterium]|nr:nucleotidyltransferase [Patescibacteria group bacterium]
MISEEQIQNWSRALSEIENEKCISTVATIKNILQEKFGDSVDIFLQGSYRNSTNVRQDSDVDIIVCYNKAYFPDLSGLSDQEIERHNSILIPSEYSFSQFKSDVEDLMRKKFPLQTERKNKCVFVKGDVHRVNADIVPCFILKRFRPPYYVEAEGIQFFSDKEEEIKSFPRQHYENGADKNEATDASFKSVVRILKNSRNMLIDKNEIDEKLMPSFFLECLIWNVPNIQFNTFSEKRCVNSILKVLWADMDRIEVVESYTEISNLMLLFQKQKAQTPESVKLFLSEAYNLMNS